MDPVCLEKGRRGNPAARRIAPSGGRIMIPLSIGQKNKILNTIFMEKDVLRSGINAVPCGLSGGIPFQLFFRHGHQIRKIGYAGVGVAEILGADFPPGSAADPLFENKEL